MLSAKQQISNIKHGRAIKANICPLTFGPLCILCSGLKINHSIKYTDVSNYLQLYANMNHVKRVHGIVHRSITTTGLLI